MEESSNAGGTAARARAHLCHLLPIDLYLNFNNAQQHARFTANISTPAPALAIFY